MLKSMNKIAIICIAFVMIFSLLSTVQAFTVAFEYEGWGIRNVPSIGEVTLDTGQMVRIRHTQERDEPWVAGNMYVSIERRNWYGRWGHVWVSPLVVGDTSETWHVSLSQGGRYRLRFTRDVETSPDHQSFYIKGDFSR